MKRHLLFFSLILFNSFSIAQIEELELVDWKKPFTPKGKITSVNKILEKNMTVSLEINIEGYPDLDKKYFVKATILNKFKGKISFIKEVSVDISSNQLEVDLKFNNSKKVTNIDYLNSYYVELEIFEDLGIGAFIKNTGIPKEKYIYRLNKKWGPLTVGKVKIKLTAYESAKTIRKISVPRKTQTTNLTPPNDTIDRTKKGPGTEFEVLTLIESDADFEYPSDIINVFGKVYQDVNPHSGYFYYLPAEYALKWDVEEDNNCGFAISKQYLTSESDGGGVIIKAELTPNISRKDLEVVEVLVKRLLKGERINTFKKLVSMPLASPPKLAVSDLKNFNVSESSVSIIAPSDLLKPMRVSWRMNKLENLKILLTSGVFGEIAFMPSGENSPAINIPVSIKLDHPKTFNDIDLKLKDLRNPNWETPIPFSMKLMKLHLLRVEGRQGQEKIKVYTWELGNERVSESTQISFDTSELPSWLDRDKSIKRVWLEYRVSDCEECNRRIFNCITD